MSHLRTFAKFNEKGGRETYRIVCQDQADVQAANELGLDIWTERFNGKTLTIAFASRDKDLAHVWQDKINNLANSIRLPKGSTPEDSQQVRKRRQEKHTQHQAMLGNYRRRY